MCPSGTIYIVMCFLTRTVEALGSSAVLVASFAIVAHEFPDNVATVFVSFVFRMLHSVFPFRGNSHNDPETSNYRGPSQVSSTWQSLVIHLNLSWALLGHPKALLGLPGALLGLPRGSAGTPSGFSPNRNLSY